MGRPIHPFVSRAALDMVADAEHHSMDGVLRSPGRGKRELAAARPWDFLPKLRHPANQATDRPMPVRLKKLIGIVVLLLLVVVYAVFATAYASLYLGNSSGWVHLLYFLFSGLLWIVPAMFVIRWMEREPRRRSRDA